MTEKQLAAQPGLLTEGPHARDSRGGLCGLRGSSSCSPGALKQTEGPVESQDLCVTVDMPCDLGLVPSQGLQNGPGVILVRIPWGSVL